MSLITKRALAASLCQLLSTKTLDKITVKDITDNCEVNRQTFYYHFRDVYDLMEWTFANEMDSIVGAGRSYKNWKDAFPQLLDALQQNRTLVLNAYRSVNTYHMQRYLSNVIRPDVAAVISSIPEAKQLTQENLEFMTEIVIYALFGIFLKWIDTDMQMDRDSFLNKFYIFLDGSLEHMVHNFVASQN
ncbi:MAG: TetR/AcrR family transcriptional regulator C-terminal domain-containing protein [Oscillospiraceae bacterium]